MTTATTDDTDLAARFRVVKEKLDSFYRQSLESEAKKKALEEQINAILAELKELGIAPNELKTIISSLAQEITSEISKLENLIVNAENTLKENAQ